LKLPSLLTEGQSTFILDGNTVIQNHKAIKVVIEDDKFRLIMNKKINQSNPIDIVLNNTLLKKEYAIEFGRGSDLRVNFFFVIGKPQSTQLNIILKAEAKIDFNLVLIGKIKNSMIVDRFTTLNENASLKITTGYLTHGILKVNESVLLKGSDSEFDGENLVIGQNNDEVAITQNVRHSAKRSSSLIHNSIVANDASKIKFDIYGTIDKTMEHSKCFQHSKGVILGEKSWIEVDPKLIINEYDVEAGHGAAIGQINQDELYYLSSRGLTENHAKRLIIQGYTDPFITKFVNMNHQRFVNQLIIRKMGGR